MWSPSASRAWASRSRRSSKANTDVIASATQQSRPVTTGCLGASLLAMTGCLQRKTPGVSPGLIVSVLARRLEAVVDASANDVGGHVDADAARSISRTKIGIEVFELHAPVRPHH